MPGAPSQVNRGMLARMPLLPLCSVGASAKWLRDSMLRRHAGFVIGKIASGAVLRAEEGVAEKPDTALKKVDEAAGRAEDAAAKK